MESKMYFIFCSLLQIILNIKINALGNDNATQIFPKVTIGLQSVEKIYLKYVLTDVSWQNFVCDLSKEKKITLCRRIFNLYHFLDQGIYINNGAFFIRSADCEKHSLFLKTRLFFLDEEIKQKMFPCYARHHPLRTNYKIDDYYEKFYISSGMDHDSVIVYIRENDTNEYNVYSSIERIQIQQLQDSMIRLNDIVSDFESTKIITTNNDQSQIERISVHERYLYDMYKDPICALETNKKIALCEMVLKNPVYKTRYWLIVDKSTYNIFSFHCYEKLLKINHLEHYRDRLISQRMYPCYTRLQVTTTVPTFTKYFKYFYISSGVRNNSVNVYIREDISSGNKVHLFQLLENVIIDEIEPIAFGTTEKLQNIKKYIDLNIQLMRLRNTVNKIKYETKKSKAIARMADIKTTLIEKDGDIKKDERNNFIIVLDSLSQQVEYILNDENRMELGWGVFKRSDIILEIDQINYSIQDMQKELDILNEREKSDKKKVKSKEKDGKQLIKKDKSTKSEKLISLKSLLLEEYKKGLVKNTPVKYTYERMRSRKEKQLVKSDTMKFREKIATTKSHTNTLQMLIDDTNSLTELVHILPKTGNLAAVLIRRNKHLVKDLEKLTKE